MRRYGMAVATLYLTLLGPLSAGPHLGEWPIVALLVALALWTFLEFLIGLRQPFEGRVPKHWLIRGMCLLGSLPGLIMGSLLGGLGLTLATIPQTIIRLRAEEHLLEQEFGAAFRDYQRHSWRLLPFVY